MDQSQRDLRYAATRAFLESLDQLEADLTPEELAALDTQMMDSGQVTAPVDERGSHTNVQALEAAAADIEKLMRSPSDEDPTSANG
ncbi:hypothetical protein IQ268_18335 [Oculatella sp. LEGE 06141]|uniref:hypothetical protein n=1 Tax=Oculatella sp. LEGE 06141 TaxID=1828648 RepID=UPI00187FE17C|nr:hypothetical protein [Oculatella sp. LEGE 06141]MBE9180522.1 hypothetical protein [Oculatella sp. LEGE 06141]